MYTYQDLKAKFPGCYSVGADVITRIGSDNVVVAELGNGSFNLTKKGQELMSAEGSNEAAPVKEAKAPNPRKGSKAPKAAPAEAPPVQPESISLDDILAE